MNIQSLIRPNILKLKPYTSARDTYSDGILLDANENPYGSVIPDDYNLKLNRYPDPNQRLLRSKTAEYLGVSPEQLVFTVGADEVIDILIRIFCEPGKDTVIIPEPTYGIYQVQCDINNVPTIQVALDEQYQPNTESILEACEESTKMIFLCSPNNPTGNTLDKEKVLHIVRSFKGIVVIDEAYIDFCEEKSFIDEVSKYRNLVLLRTFSKAWGLAGVRCGFGIADPEIIQHIINVKAPYNISKFTANAVLTALENKNKRDEFIKLLLNERKRIIEELEKIDAVKKIFPTDANYVLFCIDNATTIQKEIAEKGVVVRDRSTQLHLENTLRISVGTPEENDAFLKMLKDIVG